MAETQTNALEQLLAAWKREAEAREQLEAATKETGAAIRQAVKAGMSWQNVADALGQPLTTVRVRALGRGDEDQRRGQPKTRRKRQRPEGMANVRDSAAALGVTRQTVYAKIARGELKSFTDDTGFRWVQLPKEALDKLPPQT